MGTQLINAVPRDRLNIIFWIFLINGIGTLLPWNMLINADNYFVNYKLNVTNPSPAVADYRSNFLSYLGIASKAPNILLQILNMFIGAEQANLSRRISFTLVIQIAVFLFIIGCAVFDSTNWPGLFFWLTMGSAMAINLANGVYQGCVYGLAGRFPITYTNAVTIGMNLSGTLASCLMIISIAVSPSAQIEAIIFFSMAVGLLAVCYIAEFFVTKNTFYKYYSNRDLKSTSVSSIDLELSNCPVCFKESHSNVPCVNSHLHSAIASAVSYSGKPINSSSPEDFSTSPWKKYVYIVRRIWIQLINIILIYTVSLSIFPALNARIISADHFLSDRYFAPVFCFLFFNLFATVGNFIAQYVQWPGPKYLVIFCVARIAFIPFFLYCNYYPTDNRTLPVLFDRDWMYIAGAIAMAMSSGFLSSLVMMYIPKCVHPQLSATAGMFAALTIILGILMGINLSLLYPLLVTS